MKRLSILALYMAIAIAVPVLAADNLSKGCALYNSGQYDKALAYLQDTVSKNPRAWQGHYYLAHTYLALGQKTEAFQQYRLCQYCKPTPQVAADCEKIVSKLAVSAAGSVTMPSASRASATHDQYLRQQKQAILDDAGRQAQSMRDATLNRITNGTSSSGGNYSVSNTAPLAERERARQLKVETAKNAETLYEVARKKARAVK